MGFLGHFLLLEKRIGTLYNFKRLGNKNSIAMNYPAASGRGIRIKIDSIVDFGVAAGILYLVLLHISLSYLHPHAFLPYLRNIHHSKTLLPTTAFSLEDTF